MMKYYSRTFRPKLINGKKKYHDGSRIIKLWAINVNQTKQSPETERLGQTNTLRQQNRTTFLYFLGRITANKFP